MAAQAEDLFGDLDNRMAMLQAGLDLIDQGFTLFDQDLRLVAGNRAFAEMLEFPQELMRIGTPFEAFMRYNAERGEYGPGDVDALVRERVDAARQFQPHTTERERPGGQIIAIRGVPLPHRGFVTLYTDITEQRKAERLIRERNADLEQRVLERTRELRRSEERLRLITDAIPALIAYIDKDEVYRFANRGYLEWFRRAPHEFVGCPVAEVIGPALYDEVGAYIKRALAGEVVSYEYAMQVDGETRHARSEMVPEVDNDGEVQGAFVLSADITEQKRTQATLMQAQKMEAVGQLAGGIAHDLNNMLTVVLGNLSALEERTRGNADAQELVEPALLATRRGAALIKRLLTFSRQQPLEPRPVDVVELVDGLRTLLRRSLPENITLSLQVGGGLAHAMTDPHQLESALLNLCLNARDAMTAGGTLTLSAAMLQADAGEAAALGVPAGRYVSLTVADTGHGMDSSTLMRACEPYFTTKRFGSGSGLGLAMVYGFAQQSGGALRIRSAPGEGAVVSLLLPATEKVPAPTAEPDAVSTRSRTSPLVLLVEDDADVRQVVRRQLVDLGYMVVEAADGREALDLLSQIDEIRYVISDVVMPGGLDGPALARNVRATRPDIGILLISGYDHGSAGADEFPLLDKPFTKPELAAALAGSLS
ncbi:PAS-domain containing protein [Noviherbaspirillum denitrificans]|uniref:histidine kinase n=1 Tax=Noviherbaspirillum denitrificans TaxID=1968433 RepID=A0A254T7L2_9BURK|nr:PAS-domain containing protein [Noviherbaspirillum denitrificans]OWW18634.1 hybrid sensor histidine kinase/response regulator [Noviherbaspirillum denitrificans]